MHDSKSENETQPQEERHVGHGPGHEIVRSYREKKISAATLVPSSVFTGRGPSSARALNFLAGCVCHLLDESPLPTPPRCRPSPPRPRRCWWSPPPPRRGSGRPAARVRLRSGQPRSAPCRGRASSSGRSASRRSRARHRLPPLRRRRSPAQVGWPPARCFWRFWCLK